MKILIVGGGLGGMMLAASLQTHGLDYELIEKSSPDDDRGFSLGVWCNTRSLFHQLHLKNEFDQLGSPIHRYNICNSTGHVLRAFRFDDFYSRYGMAYTQVNRRQLRSLLQSKTDPEKIIFRTQLISLHQHQDHVEAAFSNNLKKNYDLIVAADGVHSTVRQLAFGPSLQTFTGWRAWYVWIDPKHCPPDAMVEYLGKGTCLGLFADGPRTLAIFFARCDPNDRNNSAPCEKLMALFHRELATIPNALADIPESQILSTDLAIIRMKQWTRGRVVLMGDAAHTFEPHTGLGASMAMEDGFTLAQQLSQISPSHPLPTALAHFQQLRKTRRAIGQSLNRKIRLFAFIQSGFLRSLANHLIPHMPESLFVKDYHSLFQNHCGKPHPTPQPTRQFVTQNP